MFKKTLKQTQSHNLKSSDRRKLLKQLQEQFPNIPAPSNDEEDNNDEVNPWKLLIPTKNQNVESSKFVIYHQNASTEAIVEEVHIIGKNVPNKKKKQQQLQKQQLRACSDVQTFNVITVDNVPMFFSIEKEEIYYPTIFALQIAPNLVDTIYIAQPVSHYLLQGADLMKPGVSKNQKNQNINLPGGERLNHKGSHGGIGPIKKGDIRSVQVRGNPIPFAIGDMIMDFNEFESADKGKCFETIHIFNDFLWQFGVNHSPSTYSQPIGFTPQIIEILVVEQVVEQQQPQIVENVQSTPLPSLEGKSETGSDDDDEPTVGGEASSSSSAASDIKPEEMDSLLESYFLTALKSSVEDDQLPMEGSGFYTKMFEFSEDVVLDIKKSTFKKWSKFLKQMQKENLVKMKDVKGTFFVTNINRSHPKYLAAREIKKKASSSSSQKSVQVIVLKKPTSHLLPIFGGASGKDKLFTEKEVRDHVIQYTQNAKLFNNGKVKIDDLIYTKVFKSGKSQPVKLDSIVPVQNVIDCLLNEMVDHYAIVYDGNENEISIHKGACPGISLEAEAIMGNKVITKVNGVKLLINNSDLNCVAFEDFAKKLKNKCSASIKTNTSNMPTVGGGIPEADITIQGNHLVMIEQILNQDYGFPSRFIFINDKTNKKKKKK